MDASNRSSIGVVNKLRLGFAVLFGLVLSISGGLLLTETQYWFGGAVLGIGLLMMGVSYRSYRAFKRPDKTHDERTQRYHERAGYNAFWAVIFGISLYGFYPIAPTVLTNRIETTGATVAEFASATGLCLGLLVYGITWGALAMDVQ